MTTEQEIHEFLLRPLKAINKNDTEVYYETIHADLTLYEWWVTPAYAAPHVG